MERRGDSILKEKRFEYRAYVQLFYYPNHMKAIKEDNKNEKKKKRRKRSYKNYKKKTTKKINYIQVKPKIKI